MSDKDLQRLTKCVSYIGQPVSPPRVYSNRPYHVAQKVNITSHCSLSISDEHEHFVEFCFRPKGSDCSSEFIALHVVIARLMSLALQYGAPLRRSAISSQAPNVPHVAPCPGTIASALVEYAGFDRATSVGRILWTKGIGA